MGNAFLTSLFPILFVLLSILSDRANDIKRIDFLSETTDFHDDYSVVKQNCDEIIRLSAKIARADYMLVGYYTLCWSAENYGEIEDLHRYVDEGMKILNKNYKYLMANDTGRMIMANMIHASGTYHYTLGNFNRAIEDFLKIVPPDTVPLTQNSDILFAVYNYLGQSYFNSGTLDRSIRYFELANRYNQTPDDFAHSEALYLMYKAQYEYSTGEKDKAFTSLNKAIHLLVNDPRKLIVRRDLKSLYLLNASYYRTEGEYDSAIYFTKKSMRLFSENDPNFINGYRLLGDIYYSSSKPDSALLCYYKSIEFSNRIYSDVHHTKGRSLCGIANILRDNGDFDRALHFYRKSMENVFSPLESMRLKVETARLYYNWFAQNGTIALLDSGLHLLESALYLNDLCRREQFNHESKESRSVIQAEIAGLGTEMASKGYDVSGNQVYIEKCFHFMEKNKGNILLDKVYELNARNYSGIPRSVLQKETRLRGEISFLRSRMNSDINQNNSIIKTKYDDKQLEYFNLISDLEKKYSGYYRLKYEKESVTIGQLQDKLKGTDELVILYYNSNNKIFIAGISKDQTVLKITEKDPAYNDYLSQFIDQMEINKISESEKDTSLLNNFIASSEYLYLQLLDPVLKEFKNPVRKITLVPDASLCYLPFEALLTSHAGSDRNFGNLPYLIRKYQISYEYSASMLLTHTNKKRNGKIKYLGFAPDYEMTNNQNNIKSALVSLPSIRDEIESCRHVWKGNSFIGNVATENNFAANANRYDIVHMAVHTVINDVEPQSSCMVFTASPSKDGEGMLFVSELYDMELNSALIILSGCETGTGRFKNGEGIISLARAFRYAGCPSLLMSLWKINDKSAREVMVRFNSNLKRGMDKARALQKAKTDYLKSPGNMHPAYWAGFVIIGDSKPLISRFGVLETILVVLLLVVVLYVMVKRKKIGLH